MSSSKSRCGMAATSIVPGEKKSVVCTASIFGKGLLFNPYPMHAQWNLSLAIEQAVAGRRY